MIIGKVRTGKGSLPVGSGCARAPSEDSLDFRTWLYFDNLRAKRQMPRFASRHVGQLKSFTVQPFQAWLEAFLGLEELRSEDPAKDVSDSNASVCTIATVT